MTSEQKERLPVTWYSACGFQSFSSVFTRINFGL
jgi:hypothetical protein